MDGQEDAASDLTALPQIRSRTPLLPRRSPPRTPPKQIRRKSSFVRRVDSSEDSPSPHSSIFEALYQSNTNSDDSGHLDSGCTRQLPVSGDHASAEARENDENARKQPASVDTLVASESRFLYGHGTVLETITERTSLGSIRLARAKSVGNLQSVPPADLYNTFVSVKSPQRKKSLSLDDMDLVKDSQDVSLVESTTDRPMAIHEIYAEPKVPIKEPPGRPETPPGMPSWTEHQLRTSQLRSGRRASTGLRQLFGIRSSRAELQDREQSQPNGGRSVSDPIMGRPPRIARFRPPKSSYSRIDQHPFNNAPTAAVDPFLQQPTSTRPTGKRKSVRFTPSTTARGSEAVHFQAGIEQGGRPISQPIAQAEPISPIQSLHSRQSTPEKQRVCPHRRGRRVALKQLKHSNSTIPGIDYQAILSHPLTREDSFASLPHLVPPSPTHPISSGWPGRGENAWDMGVIDTESMSGAISNTSATHLMTGALLAPSPSPTPASSHPGARALLHRLAKNSRCWRCKLETLGDKLEKLRKKSASCLWFVCCGFDADEDGSTYAPRNVRVELGGQVTEVGGRGRARDRRWGGAESPVSPSRQIECDNARPWIL